MPTHKILCDLDVGGEVKGTSLDINGTANISNALTLEGTTDQILILKSTDDGAIYQSYYRGSDRHAYLGFGGSGDGFNIMNEESGGTMTLGTASTTALTIDSSQNATFAGNVLIPSNLQHVNDDNNEISFGTDTQDFRTNNSSRLDISNSGVRFGGTGARITQVENNDSLGTSDTKLATQGNVKAYVDTSITNLVDSAPGALDTLNELAAALGDDASFSTTVTNSIATKLPLAGGTMTGAITMSTADDHINFDVNNAAIFDNSNNNNAYYIRNGGTNAATLQIGTGSSPGSNIKLTLDGSGNATFVGEVEATSLDINGNADISGDLTLSGTYPRIFLTDSNSDDDWSIINNNGSFGVYNDTDSAYALTINGSNNTTISGTLTVAGADAITIPDYILHDGDNSKFGFPSNDNFKIRLAGSDTFTMSATTATFNNNVEVQDLDISGTATGDGSGLTELNGSNIASGTIAAARVATLNQNTTGSSGSCTGNAATATTATNANNVKTTSVSNSADYFGVFVDANGTAYQDLHVGAGLKYNPSTNVLTAGKITSDTVSIVENAKSGAACMTITGAGSGTEANIALKVQGTAHGSPVKVKIKGEDGEGAEVGAGLLSFDPAGDTFGIGQSTTHNSMAMSINNSDQVAFKNMATFTSGIDITGTTDATDATGDTGILRCEGGASIAKKLYVGSTITGSADVIAYSDERLKKNVKTLDGKKVLEMRGVSFERTDSGKQSSGVIAQELEKVAPELVIDDGSYKGVAYGNVVGYLIEAIKDQQKQIDELKEMCSGCSK